ncbi:MAG: hypothetical protein ACK4YP_23125, partial [Myxococcota bacterium]
MSTDRPALFDSPSDDAIATALVLRARRRLATLADAAVADLLADTVFHERKRLETDGGSPAYAAAVETAATTLRHMRRTDMDEALDTLV